VKKQTPGVEKRSEERKPANGEVWFVLEGPTSLEFKGRLIDSSTSGFRATHSHAALSSGQPVSFRHSLSSGRALVMWSRILASEVESGFLILDNPKR
jgi:hypothetical protein